MTAEPKGRADAPTPIDPDCERLLDFIAQAPSTGSPTGPLHQAKRLLLSRLWASATAAAQPAGQDWLQRSAALAPPPPAPQGPVQGAASIWWLGRRSTRAAAADVNQRLSRRQPHAASHLPTVTGLCPDLLPGLVASAEADGLGGRSLLLAWAVGTEVALAQAAARAAAGTDAMPAVPAADLGMLAAHGRLRGLDRGAWLQRVLAGAAGGPDGAAMAGLAAVARELPAPGQPWRLQSLLLHTRPAAAVALAPIEAALRLRAQAAAALPQALTVALSPTAWPLADDGDVAHGVAAAWLCGQYTLDEELPQLRQSPALAALRQRIVLRRDATLQGLTQAGLSVVDADGRVDSVRVEQLLGAPDEPLSDAELAELFRQAADDLVLPRRAGEILNAVWGLDRLGDVGALTRLLCRPG